MLSCVLAQYIKKTEGGRGPTNFDSSIVMVLLII